MAWTPLVNVVNVVNVFQPLFTAGGAYTLPPVFDDAGSMFGAAIKLREFI